MSQKKLFFVVGACLASVWSVKAESVPPSSSPIFVRVESENDFLLAFPSTFQLGIQINRASMALTLGVVTSSRVYSGSMYSDKSSETSITPGFQARVYLADPPERGVVPFVYGSLGTSLESVTPGETTSPSIFFLGAGVGGEYFIDKLSIGGRLGWKRFSESYNSTDGSEKNSLVNSWLNTAISAAYHF